MTQVIPTDPVQVDILADQPFVEVGQPRQVVDDDAHNLFVVAGELGVTQWFGFGPETRFHPRVGVYARHDLSCQQVVRSPWPVNDIAIHPSGTFIAVGTGSYDGGYAFSGELLILDLLRGTARSVLRRRRQVCSVRWLEDTRLAVVLAPPDDYEKRWNELVSEAFELEADWREVGERTFDLPQAPGCPVPFAYPKPNLDAARTQVQAAAAAAGRSWTLRRAVWSVAGEADGSVLAACEGVAAERWGHAGGEAPLWRVSTAGTGCQLAPLTPTTIFSTVEFCVMHETGVDERSEHQVIEARTGRVITSLAPGGTLISAVAPGSLGVLRRTLGSVDRPSDSLLIDTAGNVLGSLSLTRYDLFNHWFDIARAPAPLLLVGEDPKSYENKWVARAEHGSEGASIHPLFPFDWEKPTGRHLQGGPGAFVDDDEGPAILHCGQVHSPTGKHRPFAVRRDYPSGTTRWVVDLPGITTDASESDGVLAVTTLNGWLVLIDSLTGRKLNSVELRVRGLPVIPLSVSAYGDGRLAVGLLDGRILRLARRGTARDRELADLG